MQALSRLLLATSIVGLFGCVGCGTAGTKGPVVAGTGATSAGPGAPPPTIKAQIAPTDDDPGGTAQEVFDRGKLLLGAGKAKEARPLFDRVVAAEQAEGNGTTALGRAAAYNGALASEALDLPLDARDRFRKLALSAPETPDAIDANLRRARLDVELEDYDDLGKASSALLARVDLADWDRAETFAYQALAAIRAGDLPAATPRCSARRTRSSIARGRTARTSTPRPTTRPRCTSRGASSCARRASPSCSS
ncbi:MAG: hypothetical protein IPJ34_43870, partial [Myxococcales bacterium]|nr:hypothetical protein [Myxococcales bacterium]